LGARSGPPRRAAAPRRRDGTDADHRDDRRIAARRAGAAARGLPWRGAGGLMERLEPESRRELGRFGPAAGLGPRAGGRARAVGTGIAANAWPARLMRDGTLVVHTRDSVWAFELTQRADEIHERLGPAAPEKLRFVAGPVPEPDSETAAEPSAPAIHPGPG